MCLFAPFPYYKLNKGFFLGFLFKPESLGKGSFIYYLLGIASVWQDKGGDRSGITISKCLKMIESKNLVEDKVEAVWCNMGLVARKPVFGVSDKARLKPVSSATETG